MSPLSNSTAVAVYCASSLGSEVAFRNAAISVGKALARNNRRLIYGGGSKGIMGVVSNAVVEEGGTVTGVMPYAMHIAGGEKAKTREEIGKPDEETKLNGHDHKEQVEVIVVNSMHERKVEMARRAGGFIGLPGGFGTFEEVFEVVTWTQLGIHDKPVVLVNVLHYYDPLRQLVRNGIREGFIQTENENLILYVDGPANDAEHESFDWGTATLEALDSWKRGYKVVYNYDWTKRQGSQGETKGDELDSC